MRANKFVCAASMAALVVAIVLLAMVNAAPSSQEDDQQVAATTTPAPTKMPSLFDFEGYKKLFKKSYSGLVEHMARFKWYTSCAVRASISAIKYRFRYENYHLAINHMSDMSPDELDAMRNRAIEEESQGAVADGDEQQDDDLPEFIPADDENVVVTIRKLIDENEGKPEFEALRAELGQIETARRQQPAGSARRKREAALSEYGPRELPLSKLVNIAPKDPDAELPAETRAKIRMRPRGNNPLYEGIEVANQGLVEQQTPLTRKRIIFTPDPPAKPNMVSRLNKTLGSLRRMYLGAPGETKLPDEVFIDLRKSSNCLFAPRDQGKCGSCYSFAATTVAEYLHCRATGELVAFSEQYVIDCGREYQHHLNGCNGGLMKFTNEFFHNFGWELRSAYPYKAREQQCPYSAYTDLRKTGYIRADMHEARSYDMALWPEVLKKIGPLGVRISTGRAFKEYGSGVFDACVPGKPSHAVVLVGHGREDGEEYWLIRNSYSVGWGEDGYIKLSKKADCISPRRGVTFGVDNDFKLVLEPIKNELNDGEVVKNFHRRQLIEN